MAGVAIAIVVAVLVLMITVVPIVNCPSLLPECHEGTFGPCCYCGNTGKTTWLQKWKRDWGIRQMIRSAEELNRVQKAGTEKLGPVSYY